MKRFALALLLFALPLAAAPVPKVKPRDGLILFLAHAGRPVRLLRPDGELVHELPFKQVSRACLSPDGTRVAVVVYDHINAPGKPNHQKMFETLYVVPVTYTADDKPVEPLTSAVAHLIVVWTPDSKGLYVSSFDKVPGQFSLYQADRVHLFDPTTGEGEEQPKLVGHLVQDVSPDGKRLLTSRFHEKDDGRDYHLLDRGTCEPIDAGLDGLIAAAFLTDDTLLARREKWVETEHLFVDIKTKKSRPVALPKELTGEKVKVATAMPSPDGRRLVFAWDEELPAPPDWGRPAIRRPTHLTVADLDGANAKTVHRPQAKSHADDIAAIWASVEWR